VVLFSVLVFRGMRIGANAERMGQLYAALFAYGISLLIGIQAFINIGVNTGLLPTKGLTLPLVSYGGSSLVMSCIAIGILYRIDKETRWAKAVGNMGDSSQVKPKYKRTAGPAIYG
jgi:cell division protein FtsW